jgi:hypothetical protein
MATRRSNALQLFVYMSLTSARGTSAFLRSTVTYGHHERVIEGQERRTCSSTQRRISSSHLPPAPGADKDCTISSVATAAQASSACPSDQTRARHLREMDTSTSTRTYSPT